MLNTNCANCGAPLIYDNDRYGSMAKCPYCKTQYHMDRLGKIEEYKVKIMFMGKIRDFYISDICFNKLYHSDFRNMNGQLACVQAETKMTCKIIEI